MTDPRLPGGANGPGDIPPGDIPLGGDGSPVFAAPWEASAFAIAVRLSGEGHFTWDEWTATLSEEIRAAQREGDPDLGDTYYAHWLRALERLCRERGLVSQEEATDRKDAWQRAYLDTPHGKPVELAPHHHQMPRASLPCEPPHEPLNADCAARLASDSTERNEPSPLRRGGGNGL